MSKILDGHARHLRFPETFEIPDGTDTLVPGDFAKLIFCDSEFEYIGPVERMWVEVTGREGDSYIGVLRNNPMALKMQYGDSVRFRPLHVIQIEKASE